MVNFDMTKYDEAWEAGVDLSWFYAKAHDGESLTAAIVKAEVLYGRIPLEEWKAKYAKPLESYGVKFDV